MYVNILSDAFTYYYYYLHIIIRNFLKYKDVLSPLLFYFALDYVIRMVQETQVGLKLNGTQYSLAWSDHINS
jgi:hypothetical protein